MKLTGQVVSMRMARIREFPFIEGEIAGVRGKFMLDTGMQDALVINDHRVPLAGGRKVGSGHFGSGQTFDVSLNPFVADIRIGPLRYARATEVRSQDARMLERITPDFLGWVGFQFFSHLAMKLDYRRSKVTFYAGGADEFLAGERVAAVLPFETRHIPNVPVLRARIGGLDAVATLDTGMYGSMSITAAKMSRLLGSGHLKPGRRPGTFDLTGIDLGGKVEIDAPGIEVENEPAASAKAVGITEDTELELGFVFLRAYKTVWDFKGKRLYLLER